MSIVVTTLNEFKYLHTEQQQHAPGHVTFDIADVGNDLFDIVLIVPGHFARSHLDTGKPLPLVRKYTLNPVDSAVGKAGVSIRHTFCHCYWGGTGR